MKLLHVYTDCQPGDTCPKKGGQPLRLGDGQCAGESRCRHYQGMGPFVTILCNHPEAQCVHVGPHLSQPPTQTQPPQPVQESTTFGEPARGPILRVGLCEQIRGDAEVMPTETLDEIYRRTAERQHTPDGIMTKIKARWAGLNPPPSAEAPEQAMPVEAPVSTSEPAPTESESAPTQLSLF